MNGHPDREREREWRTTTSYERIGPARLPRFSGPPGKIHSPRRLWAGHRPTLPAALPVDLERFGLCCCVSCVRDLTSERLTWASGAATVREHAEVITRATNSETAAWILGWLALFPAEERADLDAALTTIAVMTWEPIADRIRRDPAIAWAEGLGIRAALKALAGKLFAFVEAADPPPGWA